MDHSPKTTIVLRPLSLDIRVVLYYSVVPLYITLTYIQSSLFQSSTGYSPRQDLVISILEVSIFLFLHWVLQLVFMEVEDLVQASQVWTQCDQLCQVQNRAGKQHPETHLVIIIHQL